MTKKKAPQKRVQSPEVVDLSPSWELMHSVDETHVKDTSEYIDQYASIRYDSPTLKKKRQNNAKLPLLTVLIPERLKSHAHWVCWREETRDGKPTKMPYNPRTGARAESDNSSTWSTYDAVVSGLETYDGIGYVLEKADYVTFVDFDNCRDPETGVINDEARHWLKRFVSYSEISQSGSGVHIYVAGNVPHCHNLQPFEIYDTTRFFVVTGQHIPDTPKTIEQRQNVIDEFYAEKFAHMDAEPANNAKTYKRTPQNALTDGDVIRRAATAQNGEKFTRLFYDGDISDYANDDSRADLALCLLLSFWCNNDADQIDRIFQESAIYRPKKWHRKTGSSTYGEMTIHKALEGARDVYMRVSKPSEAKPSEGNDTIDATPEEIRERARDVLTNGDPMKFFTDAFKTLHVGDTMICEGLMLGEAVKSVKNATGIQSSLTGQQGKGKSHAARAALSLMPNERFLPVSLSDKAIWYYPEVKTGCTIFSDDVNISLEMEGTIKRASSNWQRETYRIIPMKTRLGVMEYEKQIIPARINWVLTSVHRQGSSELVDRQMGYDVDEAQDHAYINFEKERAGKVELEFPETEDVLVCREMFRILQHDENGELKLTGVEMPFSKRIEWNDTENRRNFNIFLDMIRAFAMLREQQRKKDLEGNILATEFDFKSALSHYGSRAQLQKYHLTNNAARVVEYLQKEGADCEANALESADIQTHFKRSKTWASLIVNELSQALYNFRVVKQYRTESEGTDSTKRTGRPCDVYYLDGDTVLNLAAYESVSSLSDDGNKDFV